MSLYYSPQKIETDLYTKGKEFYYLNGEEYIGYYWSKSNGTFFTGHNPNADIIKEIFKKKKEHKNNTPKERLQYVPSSSIDDNPLIKDYNYLTGNSNKSRLLPLPFYPNPTEEDYYLGSFNRYFVIKYNENAFVEINKSYFEAFNNKSPNVVWEYYNPFIVSWQLTGTKENVAKTNKNMVLLIEQVMNRKGLQQFLKENYLKFYKEA